MDAVGFESLKATFSVDVSRGEGRPLNVPLIAPFTIASSRLDAVGNVAVRLELRGGGVGWGEAPVLPSVTVLDQPAALAAASAACGFLVCSPPMPLGPLLAEIARILPGHDFASVRAGMEMALIDAVTNSMHIPLWILFGGASSSIVTDITIPIVAPDEAAELAAKYKERGFDTLKLKVGKNLNSDIDVLRAIRLVHPDCSFILDANEGYTANEAIEVLERLHEMGVKPTLFEQPVHRDNWEGLHHVSHAAKRKYGVSIAADESCRSLEDAKRIIQGNLAHVINIKLAKLGVLGALDVIRIAREAGTELMIGGMVETRLAMGFAGHLAAGLGCFKYVDLDTPLLLSDDPVIGGYEVSGATYKFTGCSDQEEEQRSNQSRTAMASSDLSTILPRVLIVSRRCVRKNKFVDFVGEYHLDLIIRYGAVPVIVPRVAGVHLLLDSFEPIHGVLLCEGEDIDPSHYDAEVDEALSPADAEEIRRSHAGDTSVDAEKDSIELRLARLCVDRGVPFLGICRGSQVLNVACGGALYRDVGKQLRHSVEHVDYANYDGHRHVAEVVEGTPLREWFGEGEIMVNSYHHQGVRRLAERFAAMAFAPDGLVEAFYDPAAYRPEEGKFLMGLQFHPERMRTNGSDEFDYPGCPRAYQEFVKAVIAYQKKASETPSNMKEVAAARKVDQEEMEKKRKVIVRSFSIAKDLYDARHDPPISKQSDLEVGAEFLQSNTALSQQQEKRLKQMGATVRNSTDYLQRLKKNREREAMMRTIMAKMPAEQLSELLSVYRMMGQVCAEVLEKKLLT